MTANQRTRQRRRAQSEIRHLCRLAAAQRDLYNLRSAYKRVGLHEEFHASRPKRLRLLLLNTVDKVVRHARETLLRRSKEFTPVLADASPTLFFLSRPTFLTQWIATRYSEQQRKFGDAR